MKFGRNHVVGILLTAGWFMSIPAGTPWIWLTGGCSAAAFIVMAVCDSVGKKGGKGRQHDNPMDEWTERQHAGQAIHVTLDDGSYFIGRDDHAGQIALDTSTCAIEDVSELDGVRKEFKWIEKLIEQDRWQEIIEDDPEAADKIEEKFHG